MSPTSATASPTRPIALYPSGPPSPEEDLEHRLGLGLHPDHEDGDGDDDGASYEVPGLPGSFCLHYQPEIDLQSGAVVACEALLRWQHPHFGLLRPGVSLEGTRWHDRLPGIEGWAMSQVCHQAARWGGDPLQQVALNVSAAFLTGPSFFESLDLALASSGIDPTVLAIDVPVRVAAADPGLLRFLTEDLAERGVGVTLDGVGAVPPHQVLRQIPAAAWKIDLATGRGRAGLHPSVADAVAGAHEAGAVATAKAVEDLDLLQAVRDLGFDRAFGYAISPAVGATAMHQMSARGSVAEGPLFGPRTDPTPSI
ncbi:MAG: diguanylate cyclase/phosphodiesterase with sensor(s) [Ilumatobacteraceae bacterium]|nr:diguanylate cyclase/phosphodiesterase with sensor(s) [Ilumatobacteraceae bacterium]